MKKSKTAFQLNKDGQDLDFEEQLREVAIKEETKRRWKQLSNWTIFWFILILIYILYKLFFAKINFPYIFFELGIYMFIATSIIVGTAFISSSHLNVPPVLVVAGLGVIEEMRESKSRAFDKVGGPALGYIVATTLFTFYYILSRIDWSLIF